MHYFPDTLYGTICYNLKVYKKPSILFSIARYFKNISEYNDGKSKLIKINDALTAKSFKVKNILCE